METEKNEGEGNEMKGGAEQAAEGVAQKNLGDENTKNRSISDKPIASICAEELATIEQRIASTPKSYAEDRPKYILLEKTKALYTMMHSYLELFPKSEKFTLRQKIEEAILESIKVLAVQNYKQTDEERSALILEFLGNIYLLEVLIQQAFIFRYLSIEGNERIMPLVREISSIAGSRYKNLMRKTENMLKMEMKNEK